MWVEMGREAISVVMEDQSHWSEVLQICSGSLFRNQDDD